MADYFSYKGRLNRWPYFLRNIGCFIVVFILTVIIGLIGENDIGFIFIISCGGILVMYLFLLMQTIKRLHDLDKSGWYLLIRLAGIIPLIGMIISLAFELYLFLAKGTTGPNRFGPDPLGGTAPEYNGTYTQSTNSEVVDAKYEDTYEDYENQ